MLNTMKTDYSYTPSRIEAGTTETPTPAATVSNASRGGAT